jgi:hypothetical protein
MRSPAGSDSVRFKHMMSSTSTPGNSLAARAASCLATRSVGADIDTSTAPPSSARASYWMSVAV